MSFKTTVEIMPAKPETREVEIPDKCPSCGFNLRKGLNEIAFTMTSAKGCLNNVTGFQPSGSSETHHEAERIIDYECGSCGSSVIPE